MLVCCSLAPPKTFVLFDLILFFFFSTQFINTLFPLSLQLLAGDYLPKRPLQSVYISSLLLFCFASSLVSLSFAFAALWLLLLLLRVAFAFKYQRRMSAGRQQLLGQTNWLPQSPIPTMSAGQGKRESERQSCGCMWERAHTVQRERTQRERERERADQASVSKHIIMYFFKTQKATPQQRTLQNEHRERESGREREGQLW